MIEYFIYISDFCNRLLNIELFLIFTFGLIYLRKYFSITNVKQWKVDPSFSDPSIDVLSLLKRGTDSSLMSNNSINTAFENLKLLNNLNHRTNIKEAKNKPENTCNEKKRIGGNNVIETNDSNDSNDSNDTNETNDTNDINDKDETKNTKNTKNTSEIYKCLSLDKNDGLELLFRNNQITDVINDALFNINQKPMMKIDDILNTDMNEQKKEENYLDPAKHNILVEKQSKNQNNIQNNIQNKIQDKIQDNIRDNIRDNIQKNCEPVCDQNSDLKIKQLEKLAQKLSKNKKRKKKKNLVKEASEIFSQISNMMTRNDSILETLAKETKETKATNTKN